MQMKLLGITNLNFGIIDQRLIKFSVTGRYRKKWECNGTVYQLFLDFKKAYDSVRREVFHSIFIEIEISRKLVGLIQMCSKKPTVQCVWANISLPIQASYSEWPEKRRCFITVAFQLCFGIRH
jgi:hypothetical protein